MKIIIQDILPDEEEEIIIRCRSLDDNLLKLISTLKSDPMKLTGIKDGIITVINPRDVFYFESVDNKVFIYCKENVYETKQKLYEIEEEYEVFHFFRGSKSIILNLTKIKYLKPAFSGRFEATLFNGEKVIISRQYVPLLKKRLGL